MIEGKALDGTTRPKPTAKEKTKAKKKLTPKKTNGIAMPKRDKEPSRTEFLIDDKASESCHN